MNVLGVFQSGVSGPVEGWCYRLMTTVTITMTLARHDLE